MGSLASINIRFSVDLREFSAEMQNSLRTIDKVGQKFQSVGRSMSAYVTAPLLALGVASIKTYGDLEALDKGLISVMGSSTAAKKEFEKLREVAKLPGLGLEEAVRGSVNLQAAGFSADEARASLLAFGNALATVGKGKNELNLVNLALTQLNNKTGGYAQDLRQLTEQLPQLRAALKSAFGTFDTEKISKSGVTGRQVVKALITEFEKLPKVTGGINNAFENFSDGLKISFAQLGSAINKAFNIEGLITKFGNFLQELAQDFSNLSEGAQKTIIILATVAAAIGPVLFGIGAVVSTIPLLVSGFTVLSTAITGIVAAFSLVSGAILPILASVAFLYAAFVILGGNAKRAAGATAELSASQKELNGAIAIGNKNAAEEVGALDKLYAAATNVKLSIKERKEAVDKLQALYPAYFKNLDTEAIKNGTAKVSYNELRDAIFNKSRAVAIDNQLQANANDRINKELDLQNKIVAARKKYNDLVKNPPKGESTVISTGSGVDMVTYKSGKELVKEAAQDLGNYKTQLNQFYSDAKAQDETLLNARSQYYSKVRKLEENEAMLSKAAADKSATEEVAAIKDKKVKAPEKLDPIQNEIANRLSTGSIAAYDLEIAKLKEFRDQVASTSSQIKAADEAIAKIEFAKSLQFDPSSIIKTAETTEEMTKRLAAAVSGAKAVLELEQNAMIVNAEAFNEQFSGVWQNTLSGFAENFGALVGSFAQGGLTLSNIGNLFLTTLADMAIQVGKIAITTGVAVLGIKKALQSLNPVVAIAAGVALIAIGTLAKSGLSDAAGGKTQAFANGGIVAGTSFYGDKILARVNSGEMIANDEQQKKIWNSMNASSGSIVTIIPDIKLVGADLLISFERAQDRKNRTR